MHRPSVSRCRWCPAGRSSDGAVGQPVGMAVLYGPADEVTGLVAVGDVGVGGPAFEVGLCAGAQGESFGGEPGEEVVSCGDVAAHVHVLELGGVLVTDSAAGTADHREVVIDRPRRLADPEVALSSPTVHRSRRRGARVAPAPLRVHGDTEPAHQGAGLCLCRPVPGNLEQPEHTEPTQQIECVAPTGQRPVVTRSKVPQVLYHGSTRAPMPSSTR